MNIFAGALTQVAFCWLIERRDGAGLALTSLDRELERNGVVYRPAPGIQPKSIVLEGGLEPDDFEVAGSLSADGLTVADMNAGLWDGARARFFAIDWSDPQGDAVEFFDGELGEVRTDEAHYSVAIRGAAARLDAAASPETSALCRARFGDGACRVDLAGREERVIVSSQAGSDISFEQAPKGDWLFGQILIVNGDLRGFRTTILAVGATGVTLRDVPHRVIEPGTRLVVTHGCDKRFATCRDRFGNARNFRGEPHLPGTDLLTRYPGG